jgi:hypothetical protein
MSAADRNADYVDGFDNGDYANLSLLTVTPQWGSLPQTESPIVYYDGGAVGAIYTETPDIGVLTSALHEADYPLNQFAGVQINGNTNGFYNDDLYDSHAGVGACIRYVTGAGGTSYYRVNLNGSAGKIYIHRIVDDAGGVVKTISHTISIGDYYYIEAEHTGANTTDVRIYQDDSLLTTYTDTSEITGSKMAVVLHTYVPAEVPSIFDVTFGHLDSLGLRSFDLVNPGGIVKSLGPISARGSGLDGVTGGEMSEGGSRPYTLTIAEGSPTAEYVDFEPVDSFSTTLPHGTLTMKLFHPEGDLSKTFTMTSPDNWQSVVLASPNSAYMANNLGAVSSDILEVPISINSSSLELLVDGDMTYDGAVAHGTRHDRHLFDQTDNSWDSGTVTINQESAAPDPTPPTYQPMECYYGVYFSYDFSVGWSDADPSGFGAIDLPAGLTINSAGFCSGIPTIP